MPLTMHMIHPRVSLLTPALSMVGCQEPCGSLAWRSPRKCQIGALQ